MKLRFLILSLMGAAMLTSGCDQSKVSVTASGTNAVAIGRVSGDVTINHADKTSGAPGAATPATESNAPIECGVNNGSLTITANGVEKPIACIGSKAENDEVKVSATGKNAIAIGVNKGDVKIKQ